MFNAVILCGIKLFFKPNNLTQGDVESAVQPCSGYCQ